MFVLRLVQPIVGFSRLFELKKRAALLIAQDLLFVFGLTPRVHLLASPQQAPVLASLILKSSREGYEEEVCVDSTCSLSHSAVAASALHQAEAMVVEAC